MVWGAALIAAFTVLVHVAERCFRCQKRCSELFDFTGDGLLHGRLWILFSCSFFHGTHSHLLREMFLLILAGVPTEEELGTLVFVGAYLLSGAFGATLSWLTLRRALRSNPDYAAMPRHHVDAVADLSNSRGASCSVYGAAVLATLVAGSRPMAECFALETNTATLALVVARLLPEFFSPKSTRLRKHALLSLFLLFGLLFGAFRAQLAPSVNQAVLFWFSIHCLLRMCPRIVSLQPQSDFAAVDYAGHIYGAMYSGLCATCHICLKQKAGPDNQAWLALGMLLLSTLPREVLTFRL